MVYETLNFFVKNVIDLKVTKSPEIKMNNTRKKELESLATNFRNAIERCEQSCLPRSFKDFPHGSCGDVVPLLGRYLIDRGYGEFYYVSGERGNNKDWHSHAWLLQDRLIIDITADQFDEIEQRVIVTDSSEWHKTFKTKLISIADFSAFDDYTKTVFDDAYNEIKSKLEATYRLIEVSREGKEKG